MRGTGVPRGWWLPSRSEAGLDDQPDVEANEDVYVYLFVCMYICIYICVFVYNTQVVKGHIIKDLAKYL